MKKTLAVLAAAALPLLTLTACGGGATGVASLSDAAVAQLTPRLIQAAQACMMEDNLGDGGMSISFDTGPEEDSDEYPGDGDYDTIDDLGCVLVEEKVPDHVVDHIDSTRALDGQQTDEWNGFTARWTYHPDHGVELTLVDTRGN